MQIIIAFGKAPLCLRQVVLLFQEKERETAVAATKYSDKILAKFQHNTNLARALQEVRSGGLRIVLGALCGGACPEFGTQYNSGLQCLTRKQSIVAISWPWMAFQLHQSILSTSRMRPSSHLSITVCNKLEEYAAQALW